MYEPPGSSIFRFRRPRTSVYAVRCPLWSAHRLTVRQQKQARTGSFRQRSQPLHSASSKQARAWGFTSARSPLPDRSYLTSPISLSLSPTLHTHSIHWSCWPPVFGAPDPALDLLSTPALAGRWIRRRSSAHPSRTHPSRTHPVWTPTSKTKSGKKAT
jgi:hypothetical protein